MKTKYNDHVSFGAMKIKKCVVIQANLQRRLFYISDTWNCEFSFFLKRCQQYAIRINFADDFSCFLLYFDLMRFIPKAFKEIKVLIKCHEVMRMILMILVSNFLFCLPRLWISSVPSFMNFSFACSLVLPRRISSTACASIVFASSRESSGWAGTSPLLTDVEVIFFNWVVTGAADPTADFDTLDMVTVVFIDCCLSVVRCLFNVANDITIWSQCDERSFLACPSSKQYSLSEEKSQQMCKHSLFLKKFIVCLPFPKNPSSLSLCDRQVIAKRSQRPISSLLVFPEDKR